MLLEASKSALALHGGNVLGLEIDDTFLVAEAVSLLKILGRREESMGVGCGHTLHSFFCLCNYYLIINYYLPSS